MAGTRASRDSVSEVSIDPQPSGLRAVFLVETRSEYEADAIKGLFAELSQRVQVRKLCEGKLLSFVLQAEPSDSELIDELEQILRRECGFVVSQRSFDEMIHGIVLELARDTGSRVVEVPRCDICGKVEPFPSTIANLAGEGGELLESRCYCQKCTADAAAPSNKKFLLSLLEADTQDFGMLREAELERQRSSERSVRFKIIR